MLDYWIKTFDAYKNILVHFFKFFYKNYFSQRRSTFNGSSQFIEINVAHRQEYQNRQQCIREDLNFKNPEDTNYANQN